MKISVKSFTTLINKISLINYSSNLNLNNSKNLKQNENQKKKTKTFQEILDNEIDKINSKDWHFINYRVSSYLINSEKI